jgi:glycosyltransferase involved in cell wall biosynthesis
MLDSLGALSLVIPCYNEESAISSVLRRCLSFKKEAESLGIFSSVEILVVDDGSNDLSPSLVRAFQHVRLLRMPRRLGYGAALKAGFFEAKGEWIAMMDMDATYDPMDFLSAAPLLIKDRNHVVIGDRLSRIGGMPFSRRLGNRVFVSLIRFLHRKKVSDSCTGFRIFPAQWGREIQTGLPDDLNFSLAMTLKTLKLQAPFTEIPINYASRKGHSKLNIVFHGFEFLWTILSSSTEPEKDLQIGQSSESTPN